VFERIAAEPQIVTPTGIAVDGLGRVLVIESHTHFRPEGYKGPPADRIQVFEDRDGDGMPECAGTFFEGTRMTMNVAAARDGSVFVATRSAIYRLEDRDGDGRADGTAGGRVPTPIVRLDTAGDYPHNGLSGFAFDHAGTVYFGLGENLGASYRLSGSDGTTLSGGGEGGNIYRCRPDGKELARVATGFWNPFHVAFDAFGRLFAVDNDPDSRPPCRLLHIVDGGDYGYRFRNGRKGLHPFTAWNGELPGTLGMVAGTGEAPSGVVVSESDSLPDEYRGTFLVTSWGDHRIEQYRLEPQGASFRATMRPVVIGGDDFRPVGIAAAPDGWLYVSDWVDKSYTLHGKGRIWRLRGTQPPVRGLRPTRPHVFAVAVEARQRAATLERLAGSPGLDSEPVAAFMRDQSADVRALAARILPAASVDLKAIAAVDGSPLVRAEAMRRLADPSARDVLLKALESDDPFLQQAARHGLRRSLKIDELIALAGMKGLAADRRLGLLLILRDSGRKEADALVPLFLSDPDPRIHFAAIQWVGEHRLETFRPQLLAGLASSAMTKNLFEATLAALEQLDGKPRDPGNELPGEDYIAALVKDPRTSPPVLRRALRMLRPDHPTLTLDRLRHLVTSRDQAIAIEAVRTLSQSHHPARFDILAGLADDTKAPLAQRAEAIAGLADDALHRRNSLVALAMGEQPSLRREALRSLRGIALKESEYASVRAASRDDNQSLALIDSLSRTAQGRADERPIGESGNTARTEPRAPGITNDQQAPKGDSARTEPCPTGATKGDPSLAVNAARTEPRPPGTVADLDSWLARLDGPADPVAGERVFFHTKGPGCSRCHQVEGRGGRAGPDLSVLATGMDRRRLVESILAPSKEIAPQFVAWSVARTDGTVFTGILLEQNPEGALVFGDPQGRLIVVPRDEIAARKPQAASIMPDNLVQNMTIQEFRDLVAYLWLRK
jgi:putative membrane-bound dehydrogenase-like protein